MIYFDTSYVARLYLNDPGWEQVRTLAATDHVACCLHGKAEMVAVFHRKFREGVVGASDLTALLKQFELECDAGAFRWLALAETVTARLAKVYSTLPATVTLRAADAMHLACAAEHALKEVHSNDVRLLASASYFGLKGINII